MNYTEYLEQTNKLAAEHEEAINNVLHEFIDEVIKLGIAWWFIQMLTLIFILFIIFAFYNAFYKDRRNYDYQLKAKYNDRYGRDDYEN